MSAADPDRADGAPIAAIREAVIALLPRSHPDWRARLRAGGFDELPMMQAAIAGWKVGRKDMDADLGQFPRGSGETGA